MVLTSILFGLMISAFFTFMELGLFLAVIAKAYSSVFDDYTSMHPR